MRLNPSLSGRGCKFLLFLRITELICVDPQKKQLKVRHLQHREKAVLMISFPYDEDFLSIFRQLLPAAKYSNTYKSWYLPDNPENLNLLFQRLRGKAYLHLEWKEGKKKSTPAMTKVLAPKPKKPKGKDLVPQEYKDLLIRRRYSQNTFKVYVNLFNEYLQFLDHKNADEAEEEDIRAFQVYLIKKRRLSTSTQNQAINAIKFYYEKLKGLERKTYYIERPRKERRLPTVLSEEEVLSILAHTSNPKHRLVFAFLYATGLRVGELIDLRLSDLDLSRKTLHLKQAKGKKDRITILSQQLIPVIERYLKKYRPNYWFLEGPGRKRYSASSIRQSLRASVERAGIKKKVTPHTLRHSFATHLHEQGTDIRNIQELLGHNSPKTTEIYTYVSTRSLQKISSPLDTILQRKLLDP